MVNKEHAFSLRDAYRDVGDRAKHGTFAEKVRKRGYIMQFYKFTPHPGSLPEGEGVNGVEPGKL